MDDMDMQQLIEERTQAKMAEELDELLKKWEQDAL